MVVYVKFLHGVPAPISVRYINTSIVLPKVYRAWFVCSSCLA